MSERISGVWKEGAKSAVLTPYPLGAIGGVPDIATRESAFLNERGFESVLVVPRDSWGSRPWWRKDSMSLGVAQHVDPNRVRTDAWWSLLDPTEIKKILALARMDLIIAHEAAMTMPSYFIGFARKPFELVYPGSVFMITFHANASEEHLRKFYLAGAAQRRFRLADISIVNSQKMKEKYEKAFRSEFAVVENPVDTKQFNPNGPKLKGLREISLLDGKSNIVYVGRLEKRKGLETALQAIDLLVRDQEAPRNFRFIVAGSGPDETKLHRMVKALGIGNFVVFMGKISDADKTKLYRTANFCYFPSENEESFGNVILESMASGTPVLAGVAYGDFLVKHGENGFLLPSTNPEEAARYLRKMIENPDLMKDFGLQAHKSAQQFDSGIIFAKRLAIARRIRSEKLKRSKKGRTTSYPNR